MIIKRILNSIWREFIYGGHLLSFGFSGVVLSIIILLDIKIDWLILIIAYLISQIGYNYNHFKEAENDLETNPERTHYLQKIKRYTLSFLIIYVLILIFLLVYFCNAKFILFILFFLIIELFYTKFFKGLTKEITGFKNFYVSLCWALGGIFLIVFYYSSSFNIFFILIFLFILLRLILDTVFFDFKDIEEDKKENLLTLPIRFGEKRTLRFLHILNVLSFSPLFLGIFLKIIPFYSSGLIILYFYSLYYLKKVERIDKKNLRQLSYIIVDGQYIFWPLVIFVVKYLNG